MKRGKQERIDTLVKMLLMALMLVSAVFILRGGVRLTMSQKVEAPEAEKPVCVVIDAGHGGGKMR